MPLCRYNIPPSSLKLSLYLLSLIAMEFYQEFIFTALFSVIFVSLLGKFFSVAAADEVNCRVEPVKIAVERRGKDSLQSDEIRYDHEMKCEQERDVKVVEVKSAEISAEGSHDDVEIEEFDGDLDEVRVLEESRTIEEGDDLKERSGDFDFIKETKGKVKVNDAFLIEESEHRDVAIDSTEGEIEFKSAIKMHKLEDNEFVEEAKEQQLELEKEVDAHSTEIETIEIKVDIADVIVVKDNESEVSKEQSLFNEEDDWEAIEGTELQKNFCEAATYVASNGGEFALSSLSDDEQMQLYGLHKVATEGPCYDPQPMALKISARAKWDAWQRLGKINPDAAMEQYMSLLSEKIPGCMREKPKEEVVKHEESGILEPTLSEACMPEQLSKMRNQLSFETERRQE